MLSCSVQHRSYLIICLLNVKTAKYGKITGSKKLGCKYVIRHIITHARVRVDTCTNFSRLPSLGVCRNQILNNILLRVRSRTNGGNEKRTPSPECSHIRITRLLYYIVCVRNNIIIVIIIQCFNVISDDLSRMPAVTARLRR